MITIRKWAFALVLFTGICFNSVAIADTFADQVGNVTIGNVAARNDVRVLHDSSEIPNEIVDMVVANRNALNRPGGDNAAQAIITAFYECNRLLNDPTTSDDTLIAIGEKFSSLELDSMRTIIEHTLFYGNPQEAIELYESDQMRQTMERVVNFCFTQGIVEEKPIISFPNDSTESTNLTFDTSYLRSVASQLK